MPIYVEKKLRYVHFPEICEKMRQHAKYARAVFKCVEALGRIIIRGPTLAWRGSVVERRSLAGELSLSCA